MTTTPWMRVAVGVLAALGLAIGGATYLLLAGDSSQAAEFTDPVGTNMATTVVPATPEPARTAPRVMEIAQQFQEAVNSRDAMAVAAFAPTATDGTREFLIGGGPYESLTCVTVDGRDECHMVHGVADFIFVVDVGSGIVTEVTYVGGA